MTDKQSVLQTGTETLFADSQILKTFQPCLTQTGGEMFNVTVEHLSSHFMIVVNNSNKS